METPSNFLRAIIEEDLTHNRNEGRVVTRFPPEPNGFLHIGHAKSICLNFGLARDYGGRCHLRFDDTNPGKEDPVYVESIKEDVHWLGFDWGSHLHHASDYFERLYGFAVELIRQGKAYITFTTVLAYHHIVPDFLDYGLQLWNGNNLRHIIKHTLCV